MAYPTTSTTFSENASPSSSHRELGEADMTLLQIGQFLQALNYRYTTISPASHQRYLAKRDRAESLADIFGWNLPFAPQIMPEPLFELMRKADILKLGQHGWQSTLRWSTVGNLLLAHSGYPTNTEDAVFFGPDSYRFARAIQAFLNTCNHTLKRVADLGCGTGIGALLLAQKLPYSEILALDINPTALQLCTINAQLANTYHVKPTYSDQLSDVTGDFDLIVANPPYMLDPLKRQYRHGGGSHGDGLSREIVINSYSRLSSGGSLLLYTGVAIVAGQDPFYLWLKNQLHATDCHWQYEEIDPDVFGEELLANAYQDVDRIAVVQLTLTKL